MFIYDLHLQAITQPTNRNYTEDDNDDDDEDEEETQKTNNKSEAFRMQNNLATNSNPLIVLCININYQFSKIHAIYTHTHMRTIDNSKFTTHTFEMASSSNEPSK